MLIFSKEMQRNNVMATEKYKLEEKNSNKIFFLPLYDLSSNSKTSSITAVDFFFMSAFVLSPH